MVTELKRGRIVMEADMRGVRERRELKLQMMGPNVHRLELVGVAGVRKLQVV